MSRSNHILMPNSNFISFLKKLILFVITFMLASVCSVANTNNAPGIAKKSSQINFEQETKRINIGTEESVFLHVKRKNTEVFIIELESSNPGIVSLDSDSKKLKVLGKSINNIKIKTRKKEGSSTVTATVVGPAPAKLVNGTEALSSTGRDLRSLPNNEGVSLESKNGFRQDHANRMHTFAQDKGVFLIVRDGNPDSVVHFSNPDYMPKPMSCKAKTAKVGPNKGIVVDPTHEKQKAAWDKAIADAESDAEAKELRAQLKKAVDFWNQYGEGMIEKGYRVNNDTGVIEYVEPLPGGKEKVWEGIHGDYDLHGVYRKTDDSTEQISYGDGRGSILDGQAFRGQLNHWLTGRDPKDFIQHGGQDDWLPDPSIVPIKPPDPPAVVFFPDGRAPKRLADVKEMKHFYEYEMGVRWPYKTDSEDGRDGDFFGTKVELSVKVLDLEKDFNDLFDKGEEELLEDAKKNIKKLEATKTLQLPARYDEDDYADLYMDAAYKIASEALGKDIDESQLPVEGYALLKSSDVFKDIDKDRDFLEELSEQIDNLEFTIFKKGMRNARDVENTIDEMGNLKKTIIEKYKRKEKEIINKAFSKFVTGVVDKYPEMRKRLIGVQAFYSLYEEKNKQYKLAKKEVTKKVQPFIKKLILAKKFVNGAVLFYEKGPFDFFKILIFNVAEGQCYFMFDYVDDYLVMAATTTLGPIGPIGAFAGYALGKTMAYGTCGVMLNAVFSYFEGVEDISYSNDPSIDKWVKIFYTGEIIDANLPYDVNFFSRFGWSRDEILDKTKNPVLLNKALNKHLTNLWERHPDLRKYLDVKGDVESIEWDDKKGKEIWKIIFETANKDMSAAIQENLKNMPVPTRTPQDIEKYIVDDTTGSWLGANKDSSLAEFIVERPRMADKKDIPEEFSMGETVNVNMRFFVLGYAEHNESVSAQWVVGQGGWLYGSIIEKEDEDIDIEFPKENIKEVEKHIKLRETEFSFTVDENHFIPGYSYSLELTLKNSIGTVEQFRFPFTIKPKPSDDENETNAGEEEDNGTIKIPTSSEGNNTKEEKCKDAEEKINQIGSDINASRVNIQKIDARIDEIKKEIEQTKKKNGLADHKTEVDIASLEVVKIKHKLEKMVLEVCKKAEKIINTTSGDTEGKNVLIKELENDYKRVREIKSKATKALKKAKDEAKEAKKLFEEYKSLTEEIEDLEKQFEESNAFLKSTGKSLENSKESIGQELTSSDQNVSSKEESENCLERVDKKIDLKEQEYVEIQNDLKKIMSESPTYEITEKRLEELENIAKEAKASADTADVFFETIEELSKDAKKCTDLVNEQTDKPESKKYYVFKRSGMGYHPKWSGWADRVTGYDYFYSYVLPSEVDNVIKYNSRF